MLKPDQMAHLMREGRFEIVSARRAVARKLNRGIKGDVRFDALPGRLEWRGPDELWDGAHNAAGLDWLLERLPERGWVVVASILRDKDLDGMLERLARAGKTLIATSSSSPRALDPRELGDRAEPYFARVEVEHDAGEALRQARSLGPVLVTGSLYLLADLADGH